MSSPGRRASAAAHPKKKRGNGGRGDDEADSNEDIFGDAPEFESSDEAEPHPPRASPRHAKLKQVRASPRSQLLSRHVCVASLSRHVLVVVPTTSPSHPGAGR